MIIDKLSNLSRYKSIDKNFAKAVEYIEKTDLSKLGYGKFEISGSDIFLLKMEVDTYDYESSQYEVHNVYADLHISQDSDEVHFFERGELMERTKMEYDENGDVALYELDSTRNKLQPLVGEFIFFWPGEAHAPKTTDKIRKMDKIIIKINTEKR
ncbi:YhcH/YjgK/YiaL family protein [Mycoplasmopsis agassizii]|uniref:YhcH/YjgK/YiaL family protein n=1 Tax=Mycoplasmopsis agassizii TaxID=33922 RepID=A0ABX4H440_9BACT|nr:YhcH/YjgK/YiaL family protein [Mycoplasmopsis agassizii]PAF54654.1 YhcH/YjgK/YiaL family protein [Mycoplasmopsis agassizii]SMC16138.1 YhcH/YjgK/YiaL family protein [Mycoplasmopsis agassizii]